jgi:uncharacterized protein YkwD
MKKNFITSMLTVTAMTAALSFGNLNNLGLNNTIIVSAATVTSLTNCTPKIAVQSRTVSAVTLKTGCNTTVKGYKIYRASSPNGKYKCIGTTNSTTFVDKTAKSNASYCYKVRGYKTVNGVNCTSKASKLTSVTPTKPTSTKPTSTKPQTTPTPTPTTNDSKQNYDSTFASQVLKIVNQERAKAGLNGLTMSKSLVAPANKRAMEIKDKFSHTRPNGSAWSTVLKEYNVSVQTSGENIAYGYNTPEAVMDGWMNSSGHRANILGANYKNIGIGVYEVNGTVYCTQLFSN